jgi:hypothetical protein
MHRVLMHFIYFLDVQDDDTNYHMDLIAGLANMRARNYGIPEVDKLKAKFIAGRIIPAIATSTAIATGLVCLELYKILDGGYKLEDYRNTFANLAPPLFSIAKPVPPKDQAPRHDLDSMGQMDFEGQSNFERASSMAGRQGLECV